MTQCSRGSGNVRVATEHVADAVVVLEGKKTGAVNPRRVQLIKPHLFVNEPIGAILIIGCILREQPLIVFLRQHGLHVPAHPTVQSTSQVCSPFHECRKSSDGV
jgi:hypothetical protein